MSDNIEHAIDARMLWAKTNVKCFAVVPKSESTFMRVLYYVSLMFLWNRKFMTDFHTTIGATIYTCAPLAGLDGLGTLNHELQHIEDSRRLGSVLWILGYLFPQCLALLAIAAIWWWPAGAFLLCAGPWPAPFRVWAERRGYEQSVRTWAAYGHPDKEQLLSSLKETFTGWTYYRMAWRWGPLQRHFEGLLKEG